MLAMLPFNQVMIVLVANAACCRIGLGDSSP